jgi:alternative ribosome-rescue factor
MKKKDKLQPHVYATTNHTDIGRGKVNDNFLAALVTSKAYQQQIVKAKKGKGSFQRKNKHKGQEPYLIAA